MPIAHACPEIAEYKKLAAGQLSPPDRDALLDHLEGCPACAQRIEALSEKDTLVDFIRQALTLDEDPDGETVSRLVKVLRQLRPSPRSEPAAAKESASSADDRGSMGTVSEFGAAQAAPGDTDQILSYLLAPAQSADELGRLGPYRVLKVLGKGGMGVVFQAEDPQLERLVALKAMLPSLVARDSAKQRFLREARAAAKLKHEHVVTIHQVAEDRGIPYLAMEFLEGEPLDDRLKREGNLPLAEVLRIGRETAEGLAAAHDRGLIHRDVKPANIWLEASPGRKSGECRVKILDFGLARAADDGAQLTQSGAIVGTPAYMAPEQARGETVDPRCDLFSFGCVLYRMATGKAPFRGADIISTLMAVATVSPAPPASLNADVPVELSEFILKLLAKNPEERPASAQMVADTLERIARGEQTISAVKASPRQNQAKPDPRQSPSPAVLRGRGVGVRGLSRIAVAVVALAVLVPSAYWLTGFILRVESPDLTITDAHPNSKPPPAPTESEAEDAHFKKRFVNSLGMAFAPVPKGTSWLGGGDGKEGTNEVTFDQDFYLGVHEVTQEEWLRIVGGDNPSYFTRVRVHPKVADADQRRFPVESVTWRQARDFVKQVNEKTRTDDKEAGWEYRLPTEEQWEYACRGGPMADRAESAFDFYLKKAALELSGGQANFGAGGLERPKQVGSYLPNRLGLFDMHGNVAEWCADRRGVGRVARGGSWRLGAEFCRAASREELTLSSREGSIGLRLARVPSQKFVNSLGMEFAFVPQGKSWLDGDNDEEGPNVVNVARDFYLGAFEVTHEDWEKVMGRPSRSDFSRNGKEAGHVKTVADADLKRFPVECVSWDEARDFVRILNEKLGTDAKEAGWEYRLPTEEQWEYACRGGPMTDKAQSAFNFYLAKPAKTLARDEANFADTGLKRPTMVGEFPPNKLGLFDMHGNVAEWCEDRYGKGPERVMRGGGWYSPAVACRAGNRYKGLPTSFGAYLGFRVARVPA